VKIIGTNKDTTERKRVKEAAALRLSDEELLFNPSDINPAGGKP